MKNVVRNAAAVIPAVSPTPTLKVPVNKKQDEHEEEEQERWNDMPEDVIVVEARGSWFQMTVPSQSEEDFI